MDSRNFGKKQKSGKERREGERAADRDNREGLREKKLGRLGEREIFRTAGVEKEKRRSEPRKTKRKI